MWMTRKWWLSWSCLGTTYNIFASSCRWYCVGTIEVDQQWGSELYLLGNSLNSGWLLYLVAAWPLFEKPYCTPLGVPASRQWSRCCFRSSALCLHNQTIVVFLWPVMQTISCSINSFLKQMCACSLQWNAGNDRLVLFEQTDSQSSSLCTLSSSPLHLYGGSVGLTRGVSIAGPLFGHACIVCSECFFVNEQDISFCFDVLAKQICLFLFWLDLNQSSKRCRWRKQACMYAS